MELALSTTATTILRDEQALADAARHGDDRAFEQLYAQYGDRVTAFIFSRVRDHGRAEDISQEVFMSALRQLRGSEQAIAFKPWIFAIAKNACIDEFRRAARGREAAVEVDDEFPADQRPSLSIVPSPPAVVEGKQRLEDLRGAFGGLSESHHRLLMMREFEGRSYDEIGDRLGMTRQMVESGLFRARRKLSEEYEDLASGRRCEQVQMVIETGAAARLTALGIKERRRLTQHLSHCQACRLQARMAGVDTALLKPRSIADKIAALLPFGGLWRWPWRRGGSAARAHAATGHGTASGAVGGAAQAAGSAGSSLTLGQAAAAVAAVAIAGAGGGIAIAQHSDHHAHQAAPVSHRVRSTQPEASPVGAGLVPAAHPAPGTPPASGTRPAVAARRGAGARATHKRFRTGPLALGAGTRPGAKAHGAHPPTPRSAGPTTTTPGSGSGTSSTTTPKTTLSSGGAQAKTLLNTTVSKVGQTGHTVSKVTAPVKQITDPITKAVSPIIDPVTKAVSPIIDPIKKVIAPVTQATNPVLSAPPVKQVVGPVQQILAPSPPAGGSASSGGSSGSHAGGSQNPVSIVKKVVSGL